MPLRQAPVTELVAPGGEGTVLKAATALRRDERDETVIHSIAIGLRDLK